MPDPRDSIELSLTEAHSRGAEQSAGRVLGGPRIAGGSDSVGPGERPWLGIFFRCANVYTRAYRNADGTSYLARCPRCGKTMRFSVGPAGSSQRKFEVSC